MIRRLQIRDLALMDRTELELGAGFTVVAGRPFSSSLTLTAYRSSSGVRV
jgi:DNA repair ATPase RecN